MVEAVTSITPDIYKELCQLHDPDDVRAALIEALGPDPETLSPDQIEIAADFHFYNFTFCRDQGFTPHKTSAMIAILRALFTTDLATNEPSDTMAASYQRMEKLIIMHAVERPPACVGIFSKPEVEKIVDFVMHTYYRHWRLYKYIFTSHLQVHFEQLGPHHVTAPIEWRALHEALPQELMSNEPPPGSGATTPVGGASPSPSEIMEGLPPATEPPPP